MRINVPIEELELVATRKGSPAGGRRGEFGTITVPKAQPRSIPSSLDLRGARVEEALEMLDSYVDQAAVAGAPKVVVIHGHGSGALRDALRARLSSHPLIKSWRAGDRSEGGDGATIVEF